MVFVILPNFFRSIQIRPWSNQASDLALFRQDRFVRFFYQIAAHCFIFFPAQQSANDSLRAVQSPPKHVVSSPIFIEEGAKRHQDGAGELLASTLTLIYERNRIFRAYAKNIDDIGLAGARSI